MVKQIKWSPKAVNHFESICEYIAKDSELYATIFANKIYSIIVSIPDFPLSGRKVPEYNDENLREKIYENYRIVYRVKAEIIEIVAICHGARLLKNVL
ncbi:MAG: type II toxin-antitoxin system RelE/ParE family toxin [bacterium]|nr:type II toxin-antitoxin system RelE/ParE family toxin [bacterium]